MHGPRPIVSFAALSLAVLALAVGINPLSNNDVWLHLTTGRLILDRMEIPTVDEYSFTRPGAAYVTHEWLAQVFLHLVHEAAGVTGLIALKPLALFCLGGLVALSGLRLGAGPVASYWGAVLAMGAATSHLFVRPHLFTFVLLAASAFVLCRPARGRLSTLRVLLPLQILWANLHAGFILGIAAAMLLGAWATALVLAAGSAINPRGLGVFRFILVFTDPVFRRRIREWAGPFEEPFFGSGHFWFYLLVLSLTILAAVHHGRARRFRAVLLMAGFAALSLGSKRNASLLGIVAAPWIASACAERDGSRSAVAGRGLAWSIAAVVAIAVLAASFGVPHETGRARLPGLGVAPNVPVGALDYVTSRGLEGNALTSFGFGSYVTWRAWPSSRVLIDSRLDVYGGPFIEDFLEAMSEPAAMRRMLARYPCDYAVLSYRLEEVEGAVLALEADTDWALLYFDDVSMVYARRQPRWSHVIEADAIRGANPYLFLSGRLDLKTSADRSLAELDRAILRARDSVVARLMKATTLQALGRHPEAVETLLPALSALDADDEGAVLLYGLLGTSYAEMGERQAASEAFEAMLKLEPESAYARSMLQEIRSR